MVDALDALRGGGQLSDFAMEYDECPHCKFVGIIKDAAKYGPPCQACGRPREGGVAFFELSVLVFIEMFQEAWAAIPKDGEENRQLEKVHAHGASALVCFCVLKDLLLVRFLLGLMAVLELPESIRERLLGDNNSHEKRLKQLFPALTKEKWDDTLSRLKETTNVDWPALSGFMKDATDARNKFVHEGRFYITGRDLSQNCAASILPMLELFATLNNEFIHPQQLRKLM